MHAELCYKVVAFVANITFSPATNHGPIYGSAETT